ncbi:MAG TPA: bifunctional transaldolase/phosoglucose isomerase [Vicinamibacterales bacterium]
MSTNSLVPPKSERKNPLKELQEHGQSVWLDYIRRSLIASGELQRLVDEDGLSGVTSNPAIFENAITSSDDYTVAIGELAKQGQLDAKAIFEELAILDIQAAANVLRPVYQRSRFRDGYVSLEVSPHLAHDAHGTIQEAMRLWKRIGRPNVMIKVPATFAGLEAIRDLIGEGINVNATLLFSSDVYERVAEAFISGLEELASRGGDISRVASVASFFISRIDSAMDAEIAARLSESSAADERARLGALRGRVAIANARLTYQRYRAIYGSKRWRDLQRFGAQPQRLLWASTSTKNPDYRDVVYVEELIGADTVNTIPPATFDAFRDHGEARHGLTENLPAASATMQTVGDAGISMEQLTRRLLDEGLTLFVNAFDSLLAAIEHRRRDVLATETHRVTFTGPTTIADDAEAVVREWQRDGNVRRLWVGDATLWTGTDEGRWLGWLRAVDEQRANASQFTELAAWVKSEGFTHVLLLGMGGSSLCPEVWSRSFGAQLGFPQLHVLDSTDPAQIASIERSIDLTRTLFIVSSKSGSTLEPNLFAAYFFTRASAALGRPAGDRFIAVTDPGSSLERVAHEDRFHRVCPGVPDVGGRYSALTNFGLVPAAVMGLDVSRLLDEAHAMLLACTSDHPADRNPGVRLGALLGVSARQGRDKLTLVCSPAIADLGAWLEQLIAESTGKIGKGIIPVDRETIGRTDRYGADRLFVYVRLASEADAAQDRDMAALERAGHAVVRITMSNRYQLGAEFFRWEFATAVAGSIIGIHPFDQPDVEASKIATRALTTEYERTGELPGEAPMFEEGGIALFAAPDYAAELRASLRDGESHAAYLKAHLDRLNEGDYFALLAYVEMHAEHEALLQTMRHAVRDSRRVATCLGFGPRFLHSTGQAYKGGPNSGVFLQVTCDDAADLTVPGKRYTFGAVKAAQARGDFQVLVDRGRRALRVHLGRDVAKGLETLARIAGDNS